MRRRPPRVAAVTMVRNEGRMLRKWIDHYAGQLGADHLVVIDDSSDDGSTEGLDCRVERIEPITGHFERSRMRIVSAAAERLLRKHDAVVFADADEFLVADPARYDSLVDLVGDHRKEDAVGVMALNVVHHLAGEGELGFDRPFLDQRRLAKFVPLLCKPSIKLTRKPWAAASHGVRDASYAVSRDLYMFHMKFADRGHLQRTSDHRRAMVEMDQRAEDTSWRFTGDEMVDLLDRMNDGLGPDVSGLPEFAPPADLGEIVKTFDNGVTRATGGRQVVAMERRPLVRIPERFRGTV